VHDTCLSRAGAELMAAATCLGSGALALGQVKAIAEQLMAEAGMWLLLLPQQLACGDEVWLDAQCAMAGAA
jgi:hypothetical protein